MAWTHSHPFNINTWCELFPKWLRYTASVTIISTLQVAGMHSQYYHINVTNGWDAQPALPYLHYKWLACTATITISTLQMAGMHSHYYDINITNGWDAYEWLGCTTNTTPWIPHEYPKYQQLGHSYSKWCKHLSQPVGVHSCVHCTIASFTTTG